MLQHKAIDYSRFGYDSNDFVYKKYGPLAIVRVWFQKRKKKHLKIIILIKYIKNKIKNHANKQ